MQAAWPPAIPAGTRSYGGLWIPWGQAGPTPAGGRPAPSHENDSHSCSLWVASRPGVPWCPIAVRNGLGLATDIGGESGLGWVSQGETPAPTAPRQMKRPRRLWSLWFSGRSAVSRLPQEAIDDCSAQGAVDEAVAYWVDRLQLEAPPWLLREHLRGYGAWDAAELCDHRANLQRLLWLWACDCRESGDPDHLVWLGL